MCPKAIDMCLKGLRVEYNDFLDIFFKTLIHVLYDKNFLDKKSQTKMRSLKMILPLTKSKKRIRKRLKTPPVSFTDYVKLFNSKEATTKTK